MKRGSVVLLALLLISLFSFTAHAEVTVSATMSPASFTISQAARLSITIDGAQSADIDVPETKGYDVVYRGQNSRMNIVNGSYSSSLTATYTIHPHEVGNFTLPAITISAGKTKLTTDPIDFEVTGAPSAASPQSGSGSKGERPADTGNDPFLVIENLENAHYVGEIVPITIKAYFPQTVRISQISYPRLEGEGCVIPQLKEDPVQQQDIFNGRAYTTLSWQTDLTPIKEGTHSLQLEMDAVQILPQKRTTTSPFGSRSPFGNDLFDDFFGTVRKKQITVISEPQSLTAKPLPLQGRPQDFTGAVGNYTIRTEVTPKKAEVGEPLTLTISLEGSGNMEGLEAPNFPDSPGWKTYKPAPVDTQSGKDRRVFEQAIVAQAGSVTEVPPLHFSFFNPVTEQYQTASSDPLPLQIASPATLPLPAPVKQVISQEQDTPVQQAPSPHLAPLHISAGKPSHNIRPLFKEPLYLSCIAVLVLLLASALVMKRRIRSMTSPEERRRKQKNALLQSIDDLETSLGKQSPEQTGSELRQIIQAQLGLAWDCPPESITVRDMSGRLGDSGSELIGIFNNLESAAYGGQLPDQETMRSYLKTVKAGLEKMI